MVRHREKEPFNQQIAEGVFIRFMHWSLP